MDKMELTERYIECLRKYRDGVDGNIERMIFDDFLKSDPDAKWALKEHREKQAEWLKKARKIENIGRQDCYAIAEKDIDQAFELTEKEEKKDSKKMCFKCQWQGMLCIDGDCHYKPREELTIPKEILSYDCDWSWAQKDIIKTINNCVRAIREIRGEK